MVMTLTPEQQEFVQRLVERYQFASADAVIDEALALLAEQRDTERIRRIVHEARQEVAEGKVHSFTPELIKKIDADVEKVLRGELAADRDAWS